MLDSNRFLLTFSCQDRIGIVASVSAFLAKRGCNIVESAQFEDQESRLFFMRTAFGSAAHDTLESLRTDFRSIAAEFGMSWAISEAAFRMRTLIMVSKYGHCLNDLLFHTSIGAIPIELGMIVSNHSDFRKLTEQNDILFHHIPITPETKTQQEQVLVDLIESNDIELIVLARYMQVLSDSFCARYAGRIINIHHSLLPSFKGAKPYHQAYERGVKLIGATAHYVTADLDEGPIIEQGVMEIQHTLSAEGLAAKGRDVEAAVLRSAVHLHAERRVLLNGIRTVVFR
jgi:formyltetrahydrofolate deformylase